MALMWDILQSNPNIAQQCFSGFDIMVGSFFIMENYINKKFKYSALYVSDLFFCWVFWIVTFIIIFN